MIKTILSRTAPLKFLLRTALSATVAAIVSTAVLTAPALAQKAPPAKPAAAGKGDTAKEYLLTVARPRHLQVIDMASNAVLRSCEIPARMGPGSVSPSPDGRVAYVMMDGWENIFGIDVETCKIVFSARQSEGDIKVKTFASLTVSADGKEIYTANDLRVGLFQREDAA